MRPPLGERLAAQALGGPPLAGAAAVAERLLAIQAQDERGFRLAVRARTAGLGASDVERALADRELVVSWLNRGTLHLVGAGDYHWLQALTTPPLATASARRLAQEGVEPAAAERGVTTIERALVEDGPLTRAELRERLDAAGVPTAGQALIHLLLAASLRGICVRGPVVRGREQAFVLVRDWLGEPPAVDRDVARAELARRYLAGHGPADDRDLARWAGLPLRDARAGLAAIAAELDEAGDGLVRLRTAPGVEPEPPPPRLLGAFDPVLLGWVDRTPIVGRRKELVTVNGIFRPFAMVAGRAAGVWRLERGRVRLDPFGRLRAADRDALATDAADVERFLAS